MKNAVVEDLSGRYRTDTHRDGRGTARENGLPPRRLGLVRRAALSRWFRLVAILIICGAVIFAASSALPSRYSSVAWVRVTTALDATKGAKVDLIKDQRAAAQAFVAPRVSDDLRRRFGTRMSGVRSLVATAIIASPLIRIDVEASSAELAAQVANRASAFVVDDLRNRARMAAAAKAKAETSELVAISVRIDDLASQLTNVSVSNPDYPALKARLSAPTAEYGAVSIAAAADTLQARVKDGGLEVFAEATRPTVATFPNPLSWAIIGDLAIFLIALGALYGREELVGKFRTGSASESRRSGTTVLGVLPTTAGMFPAGIAPGAGTTADEVGLTLVHLLGRDGPAIVLIADAVDDAPETIAQRVARAVAESGVRVVFGVCRSISTPDGHEKIDEPSFSTPLTRTGDQPDTGQMLVLDTGIPVNELTTTRARSVLQRLFQFGDFLILAAPSPTVEPGTLTMTQFADASVLIAQQGVTRLRDAERAATRLRRVGGNLIGVLVDPADSTAPAPRAARYSPRSDVPATLA